MIHWNQSFTLHEHGGSRKNSSSASKLQYQYYSTMTHPLTVIGTEAAEQIGKEALCAAACRLQPLLPRRERCQGGAPTTEGKARHRQCPLILRSTVMLGFVESYHVHVSVLNKT